MKRAIACGGVLGTLWRARIAGDEALSERLTAVLAGTTLLQADLLGFSSLKTYAPSPDRSSVIDSSA